MKIREIKPAGSDAALGQFVQTHGLLFHSKEWLASYATGSVTQCAILNRNDEVTGCFLYFSFKKAGFTFLITPPWMPDIALYFVNPAESVVGKTSFVKDVMRLLAGYFAGIRASHISINLPAIITDTQPFIWKKFLARVRHTYHVDLAEPEEILRKNLSPEKRKSLNKAEKDNIRVKRTNDPNKVRELVMRSLRRNGQEGNLPIAGSLIAGLTGSERAIVYTAGNETAELAAAFCVIDGDRALYLFGGYDEQNAHHGAGVSCLWNCVLEAKKLGLRVFDFEGSMDPDIERYFREFGGKLVTYQCVERTSWLVKILMRLKGHRPF